MWDIRLKIGIAVHNDLVSIWQEYHWYLLSYLATGTKILSQMESSFPHHSLEFIL